MRWIGLACGLAVVCAASPGIAGTVSLHQNFVAGGCVEGQRQVIDVPRGRLTLSLHIKNWSPAAYAGIPYWMGFQRWEPDRNMWTGQSAYLTAAAETTRARTVTSQRNPDSPKAGGVLDYTETDEVLEPFRLQVQIGGPTWHSGDGACHQGAMETFLTITTEGASSITSGPPPVESASADDPVADVTWDVCAYPNPADGCGQWRFERGGQVQGLTAGRVAWTGAWTRLGEGVYRYDFTYMGQSIHQWVRFTDPDSNGHATVLMGYPSADMTSPNRKGQRSAH